MSENRLTEPPENAAIYESTSTAKSESKNLLPIAGGNRLTRHASLMRKPNKALGAKMFAEAAASIRDESDCRIQWFVAHINYKYSVC